jgi:hypothetical protein
MANGSWFMADSSWQTVPDSSVPLIGYYLQAANASFNPAPMIYEP